VDSFFRSVQGDERKRERGSRDGGSMKIATLFFSVHLEPYALYAASAFTSTLPRHEKGGWLSIYLILLARTVCRSAAWIIQVCRGVEREHAGRVG
jgi:hypothetical protein